LNILTKARLDSIGIAGECFCEDQPPPVIGTDILVVVDGSDSYNSKAEVEGSITEGGAYQGTLQSLARDFFPGVAAALPGTNQTAVIQFSGIKQLEAAYKPGSDGQTGTTGLQHWKWELNPTSLDDATVGGLAAHFQECDSLDGNGQLYLCLQDCALPGVMNRKIFNSGNK